MQKELFRNRWIEISLKWQQAKLNQIQSGVFNPLSIVNTALREKKVAFFPKAPLRHQILFKYFQTAESYFTLCMTYMNQFAWARSPTRNNNTAVVQTPNTTSSAIFYKIWRQILAFK